MELGKQVTRIVEKADATELSTRMGVYSAQLVINCGGLHADRLAHMMGICQDYVIVLLRRKYFVVNRSGPRVVQSVV